MPLEKVNCGKQTDFNGPIRTVCILPHLVFSFSEHEYLSCICMTSFTICTSQV